VLAKLLKFVKIIALFVFLIHISKSKYVGIEVHYVGSIIKDVNDLTAIL